MEVASRSARLAWDVFSRGGRQHKVIYLIRHAHTSFSAPPPHTPLPSAPIPLASHLPLSRSASACPSASPPPAPPHTSPPLLPCQAYRHHLRRGHDVPLSPLGRQQAMDLHPTLIHIAQKSQLVSPPLLLVGLRSLLSLFPSQPSIIGPLTILPCPPSFLFLHPHCFLPVLLSSHPPVRLSPSPCPAHAPSAASVAALPCAGDSLLCLAPQHSHRHHVPLLQRPLHHHQHSRPAMLHRSTLLQRTSSSLQLICKTFELDPPILASDFPFPFLSFSHLPHHWWPHHPSHPPPTPLPSTHTPPAIPATPSPASPPPPAPITGPAAAAAGTWGAVAEPRGAPASSPPCTTPLPFAPTLPAPSSAASNPPSLHEPRAILRKRVGEFRRFLFACPEATIAVIGHSTFFMEFLASRRRMKNCEIVKICL
ncbi:unnamed protein product [Closterium sp. NIES-65]|nr:unnamed protein product [Closterium sp. NIES-65]